MAAETPHPAAGNRRACWLPFLGYLGLAVVFYAPVLLGLRWFPEGDFTDHFLPFSLFQRAEILAGRLPVWNPYTFSGHPFLADVQAAVFYPISNLVLALTLPWGGIMQRLYWLQVETMLQVALGGFFTYLLVRDLVRRPAPAFLAGCVFTFSGYLTGYPPLQTAVLRTAIWLPLVLWCLRRAFETPGWRWWVAGAIGYVVAFFGGHPQTFLYLSYCVVGWLVLLLATTQGPKRAWLPKIAVFFALFLGLSAAQLWPSVEFTALSVRADVGYAFVSGGFSLRDAWQMLAPGIVSQFSPLYVGVVALGFAVLAVVTALVSLVRREHRGSEPRDAYLVLFFAAVAVLALLASYGGNSFLYPILYRIAPGWGLFRGQERAAYLVAFALAVLAGLGLTAFLGLARRQRILAALGWAALAVGGLVAFRVLLGPSLDAAAQSALDRGTVVGAVALLAAVLVAALQANPPWPGRLLTLLVLAELFVGNAGVNLAGRPVLPSAEALEIAAAVNGPGAAVAPRVQNQGRLPDDYGMLVGVEDVGGSSPLRLARYDALLHDFPQVRLWQLAGVKTVLSSAPDLYVPGDRLAEFSGGSQPGYLHRLAADYPRAWVVRSIYTADDQATLSLLGADRVDLSQTALLPPTVHGAGRPLGLEDGVVAGPGADEVRVERLSPTSLLVRARTDTGGYLVVSENWMPGWEATVVTGGVRRSVPVLRTNLTLLGLPLAAGESTVELRYRPASVRLGLWVSLFTALLLVGAWALSRRRPIPLGRMAADLAQSSALRRLAPLVAVLAGFGLRVFRLGSQELRGDESLGRLFSLDPVPELIRSTLALREPHPVASYVIQGAWLRVAGHSEFALRFVSAWFGALAVAIFYRLVRQLGLPKRTALIAAGLLAVSPYAIWHSQDARMYSISLALTLASSLLMLSVCDRPPFHRGLSGGIKSFPGARRWLSWAGYVVVTWLALHTHYYAAYIVIAQNLFVFGRALASRTERRGLPAWIAAQLVTAVLYLPWLIVAAQTLTGYGGNGDSPTFLALWLRSLSVFVVGETVPAGLQAPVAVLGAVLAVIGALRLVRSGPAGRRAALLAGLTLLVPLLATWIGALRRPIFNERYIIAALPGFLLLIAASFGPPASVAAGGILSRAQGLSGAPSRRMRPGGTERSRRTPPAATLDRWLSRGAALLAAVLLGVMAFSLFLFYHDPAYGKSIGWRQLAAVMGRHTAAWPAGAARAAQSFPDPTLWYYYAPEGGDGVVIPPAARDQAAADALVQQLAGQGVERIVIAVQGSPGWDDNEIAPRALQGAYRLLLEVPVVNWRVQVYGRPPAELDPVGVAFSNGLRLEAVRVTPDRLIPGDVLPVHLRWQAGQASLTGNEKLTLQVLDAQGKLAAQVDQPLAPADLAGGVAQYGLLLPRTLAPGNYRLILAIYDPSKEGAPRVLTQDGADYAELKAFVSP